MLELYEGWWRGQPLAAAGRILSVDEKTSVQARRRIHPTLPARSGKAMRVEHEYQLKVLTPNDFRSLAGLEDRLLRFQEHYEAAAPPFQWKFIRRDLDKLLSKLHAPDGMLAKAA